MGTRRQFIRQAGTALGGAWLAGTGTPADAGSPPPAATSAERQTGTGSDVGSLFPVIQCQAVRSDFPLYDTPHEFNAAMQAEAWAWLGRRL
jgi:hypothetical protein